MDLPRRQDSILFDCPRCLKQERFREPMEPMCTGPGWLDTHPPTLMRRVGTSRAPL